MRKNTKIKAEEIVNSWKKDPSMPKVAPLFSMEFGTQGYSLHELPSIGGQGIYILSIVDDKKIHKQFYMDFYTMLALRVAIDNLLEDREGG